MKISFKGTTRVVSIFNKTVIKIPIFRSFLIQVKCLTLNKEKWNELNPDISKHKEYFQGDDTISNCGILKNKIVKLGYSEIDYGEIDYVIE